MGVGKRDTAIFGGPHFMTGIGQRTAQDLADGRLVVNYQDSRHEGSLEL
jgi:hypothetical protein